MYYLTFIATELHDSADKEQHAVTIATIRAQLETKTKTIAILQERIQSAGNPAAQAQAIIKEKALLERTVAEVWCCGLKYCVSLSVADSYSWRRSYAKRTSLSPKRTC
jgi:hypothetical protein